MTPQFEAWFTLTSGKPFRPFAPRAEDIDIKDIAHSLANVCRFGGHVVCHYSVAEHSIHCSYLVPSEDALAALLHDATEAYCGDMIRPIKQLMPEFSKLEFGIWQAIAKAFRLPITLPPSVHEADMAILHTEARDLLRPLGQRKPLDCIGGPPPGLCLYDPDAGICPMTAMEAETAFLSRFHELYATHLQTLTL